MDGDLEQLGERIAEQAAHFDAAMHRLLADLREFDRRGGWHVQGAMSCAHWLSWRVGWDPVTARERVRVACKLGEFPVIDDALRRGEVSYSKVRAMLRVATPANETLLLDHARLMTASQLEKLCRKYGHVQRHGEAPHPLDDEQRRYVRRRDTDDGMIKIEAVLHPEEGELIWTMLNHAATRLMHGPFAPEGQYTESQEAVDYVASRDAPVPPVPSVPPGASAASPRQRDSADDRDDSAESRQVPRAPSAAAVSPSEHDSPANSDDSAESRPLPPTADGADSSPAARVETWEASAATPRRSLLDRLLDEADAVRGTAEVVHSRDRDAPSTAAVSVRRPSVLHQQADAAKRAFSRADALVSLAQAYLRGDRPNRSPIEITLTILQSSLRAEAMDPLEAGELGDSFVSGEAARRLSCDAGVVDVIEDEHGVPISVGRKRRAISGALKRALHKRDTSCSYPGCTHRIFLEGHHIKHWADGGETSLDNAALLCTTHHRYVHEYGYAVELGPDQRPRFRDPRGRLVTAVPAPAVAADLGWPRIRAANASLAIDAETIACEWDGTPADYGAIVGHLVACDGLT
jgi:hypothetical protein